MKLCYNKSFHSIFIVLIVLMLNEKVLLKKEKEKSNFKNTLNLRHEVDKSIQENTNFQEYWGDLFSKKRSDYFFDHKSKLCKKQKNKNSDEINNIIDGDKFRLPHKKPNFYSKMGFGDSAYFFDYLDPLLLNPIVSELKRIFSESKKFERFTKEYKDPYHITMMMSGKYDPSINEKDKIKDLKRIFPKLDEEDLNSNITPTQLYQVLKNWKWGNKEMSLLLKNFKNGSKDAIIELFDKYDFDGSGRLSANEFLTLSVLENVNYSFLKPLNLTQSETNILEPNAGTKLIKEIQIKSTNNASVETAVSNCINCYKEIIEDIIKIIFSYLDCQGKMVVQSEDMWNKLKYLKRNQNTEGKESENTEYIDDKKWSMYECGEYRTSAPNDFVLKISKQKKSYVNFEEFSRGILVGIINRQTSKLMIVEDDSISLKSLRWSNDGITDKNCELIKSQKSK
jgi:hypothetical protein